MPENLTALKQLSDSYGLRPDGTPKGSGYFGKLNADDGTSYSTELSIGVNFDGKERLIPLLVPTLTHAEIKYLVNGGEPTKEMIAKAVEYARYRMSTKRNPFATREDEVIP